MSLNELASFAVPTALATAALALVVVPSVRIMVRALKVKVRRSGAAVGDRPDSPRSRRWVTVECAGSSSSAC